MSESQQKFDAMEAVRMLCVTAYQLSSACLVGNPAPMVARWSEEIRNPKPGDWVFETSSGVGTLETGKHKRGELTVLEHFGKLLRIEQVRVDELNEHDEPWDEATEGQPCPTVDAWVIQRITGEEFRWNNCSFIKVPSVPHFLDRPGALTRDSLAGTLGDSGFALRST